MRRQPRETYVSARFRTMARVRPSRLTFNIQADLASMRRIVAAMKRPGQYAQGGIVKNTGLTLVGEQGPELVTLPPGSTVTSA